MPAPFSGGCLCGAIRYECSMEPLATIQCHCRDCQRNSGSGFAIVLAVQRASVTFQRGTPKRQYRVARILRHVWLPAVRRRLGHSRRVWHKGEQFRRPQLGQADGRYLDGQCSAVGLFGSGATESSEESLAVM